MPPHLLTAPKRPREHACVADANATFHGPDRENHAFSPLTKMDRSEEKLDGR